MTLELLADHIRRGCPLAEQPARTARWVDTEHLMSIGAAVRTHEVLRFDYEAPNWTGEQRPWQPPRRAEPHHLLTWGGRWYLMAVDLDQNDWRTFRVCLLYTSPSP